MTMNNCNAQCNNNWNTLTPIGHDKNRLCGDCQRVVRLCITETEKDLNHAIGRLVAFHPKGRISKIVSFMGGQAAQKSNDIEANVYLLPEQTLSARQREEITMLENYSSANDYLISMNQSQKLPTLYGAVDYGFQGAEYKFNSDNDYVLASVVLRWNLWHGFENNAKIVEFFDLNKF